MMTSSNRNNVRVTGSLWGDSSHKGRWREALMLSLICACANSWANHRDAGGLRRHIFHYDATVMCCCSNDCVPAKPNISNFGLSIPLWHPLHSEVQHCGKKTLAIVRHELAVITHVYSCTPSRLAGMQWLLLQNITKCLSIFVGNIFSSPYYTQNEAVFLDKRWQKCWCYMTKM